MKGDEIIKAVKEIKKARVKVLRNNEWQIEDKLILKKEKVYISKNKSLKLEIIWPYYNILIAKHKG